MFQKFSTGPCFLSQGLKSFCKKFNVETVYCTVGDHRANGLVETIVHNIKTKLLAVSFDLPKPTLNSSIEKIICNLRIMKQRSKECTPFKKYFDRTANTRSKNQIFFDNRLDEGNSIISDQREKNWELYDGVQD